MKIVFLVSHMRSGGAERTVAYLSSHMAEKGWDVTVLSVEDDCFYTFDDKVKYISLSIPAMVMNLLKYFFLITTKVTLI